jgi:hypothetical protein
MSFFLPGVLAVYLGLQIAPPELLLFTPINEWIDGLISTIAVITLGLMIHRCTFWMHKFKLYKSKTMPSIAIIICQDMELVKVVSKLQIMHAKDCFSNGELFDQAYYTLEYQDKITTAKMFQSMYFFMRNMITLALLYLPIFAELMIYKYNNILLLLFIFTLIFISTATGVARFYRKKMIDRIFNTYYIYKLETKK